MLITYHKCDVCGKEGPWDHKWVWRYILVGRGYAGWEYRYEMCSVKCAEWADEHVKWRQHGQSDPILPEYKEGEDELR
jgi:hypothetical protein